MSPSCPHCAAPNPPYHNYCHACGAALAGRLLEDPAASGAERRQITVVFCDLVSSTEHASRLGTEPWSEVLNAYHATTTEVVRRLDGHVAQYLGDGVLIYFGYPRAHEDDAERAVRAGLGIVGALAELRANLEASHGIRLAVRIGIDTGLVVIGESGEGASRRTLALGSTTNVAARLQNVAREDGVVVSEATLRLVRGIFVTEDLGPQNLKGISEPVHAHRVLQAGGVRLGRAVRDRALTRLVARHEQLLRLRELWRTVAAGAGRVVSIEAEVGMGKSRLVRELHRSLANEPHTWLECQTSSFTQASAFRPIAELMARGLGFEEGDAPEQCWLRLEQSLELAGLASDRHAPALAEMLYLPPKASGAAAPVDPERRRAQTLETLARWLERFAELQPVVLLFEDLHWCDPSSLELLTRMLERGVPEHVLLVVTMRPEFVPPWPPHEGWSRIRLERLKPPDARELVRAVRADVPLSDDFVERIVERGDGIPLYLEELTRGSIEAGVGREALASVTLIPASLQDSLTARLDRDPSTKPVAQVAAVLGREFSPSLLARVAGIGEAALSARLEALEEADLLLRKGSGAGTRYWFSHALIRDSAYQSLLRERRQWLHRRAAEALAAETTTEDRVEDELIARHFEAGGLPAAAIQHYERAAERAIASAAHREALSHLNRAFGLLEALPAGADRNERELSLRLALGLPLVATHGYASPEVQETYTRARELCRDTGDGPLLFRALHGLSSFYEARGELAAALELGRELLGRAERDGDPSLILEALVCVAMPLLWRGEFREALVYFERAWSLYQPAQHSPLAYTYAQDPGIVGRSFAALALTCTGRLDAALALSRDTVRFAAESGNPLSHAYALTFASVLHWLRREPREADERAAQALVIADSQGFPLLSGISRIGQGWAHASLGAPEAGIVELERGTAELAQTRTGSGTPLILSALCEANRLAGRPREARAALAGALEVAADKGHHVWDAEHCRLDGELLLDEEGDVALAAARFEKALELARTQNALLFELRAATCLARLHAEQGKRENARRLLAPICQRFAEGLNGADLREARAVLDALD